MTSKHHKIIQLKNHAHTNIIGGPQSPFMTAFARSHICSSHRNFGTLTCTTSLSLSLLSSTSEPLCRGQRSLSRDHRRRRAQRGREPQTSLARCSPSPCLTARRAPVVVQGEDKSGLASFDIAFGQAWARSSCARLRRTLAARAAKTPHFLHHGWRLRARERIVTTPPRAGCDQTRGHITGAVASPATNVGKGYDAARHRRIDARSQGRPGQD